METADSRPHRKLRGTLGVWGIVFVVVAAASPLGVMGGPVPLGIANGNGIGFPAIFVVSTVIILLFAVGFTALTPYVPDAGAFYSYIGKGLGRVTGFGFAFVALISYLTLEIAVYGLIGQGAQALFISYGLPNIHWGIWAFVAFVIVTALGHFNIDLSRNVLGVLLIGGVAIVLALDAAVVFSGGHEGLSTGIVTPSEIVSGAPGIALLFAILSFIGFEATAVFRDEAREPLRTIPKATYLAVILIGVFYTVSTWALISAVGDSKAVEQAQADPSALLPNATEQYRGAIVVAVAILVAVLFQLDPVTQFYTWRAFIAPGIGLVDLLISVALILQNLPGLVGDSTPIAIGVVALLVAFFALGAGIAARRPHVTLE